MENAMILRGSHCLFMESFQHDFIGYVLGGLKVFDNVWSFHFFSKFVDLFQFHSLILFLFFFILYYIPTYPFNTGYVLFHLGSSL